MRRRCCTSHGPVGGPRRGAPPFRGRGATDPDDNLPPAAPDESLLRRPPPESGQFVGPALDLPEAGPAAGGAEQAVGVPETRWRSCGGRGRSGKKSIRSAKSGCACRVAECRRRCNPAGSRLPLAKTRTTASAATVNDLEVRDGCLRVTGEIHDAAPPRSSARTCSPRPPPLPIRRRRTRPLTTVEGLWAGVRPARCRSTWKVVKAWDEGMSTSKWFTSRDEVFGEETTWIFGSPISGGRRRPRGRCRGSSTSRRRTRRRRRSTGHRSGRSSAAPT